MADYEDLNKPFDPFADTEDKAGAAQVESIHIRVQQRNGRKCLTTVQGLPKELDGKRLVKAFKKAFAANGTVTEDEEHGEIIQMQGDQRTKISEFLIAEGVAEKEQIKVHGF